MPGEITIRRARDGELTEIGALTVGAYQVDGFLPDGHEYLDTLRDAAGRAADAELLVAADSAGHPVGTVTVCPTGSRFVELARDGELEFRMLAVAKSARGRGVGRALVNAVCGRARELGFERVVLCSAEFMTIAHRLYTSMGFRRIPQRDWQVPDGTRLFVFEGAVNPE